MIVVVVVTVRVVIVGGLHTATPGSAERTQSVWQDSALRRLQS